MKPLPLTVQQNVPFWQPPAVRVDSPVYGVVVITSFDLKYCLLTFPVKFQHCNFNFSTRLLSELTFNFNCVCIYFYYTFVYNSLSVVGRDYKYAHC